jgi:glycerol-3-phosphate dehydrogenase
MSEQVADEIGQDADGVSAAQDAAPFDVLIIGGGINGAGIARDAALRGLSVLLLEARDFGSGTSSWSTRLIHGGLRYLEYAEVGLVRESLHERTRLRSNARHLVKPLRITIPLYKSGKRGPLLVRLGMLAYDLLSFGKSMPAHQMLSREELLEAEPGLEADGLRGGARYYDAQVTFVERLVLENILAASDAGASVRNYCPVSRIQCRDDGIYRVRYVDGGQETTVFARSVVNAAGPWVDAVLGLCDEAMPRLMGGTKGSHIVVAKFPGAPADAVYVEAGADGRPVFIVPWNDQYLIGTTDIRVDGDPAASRASDDEIRYLINETNRVFPQAGLSAGDIHFAYAGVRPLPYKKKGPESAITRRHIIKRHRGKVAGMFSVIGGKLTTYRNLAEQQVNQLGKYLGTDLADCATRESPLPGAAEYAAAEEIAAALPGLSARGRERVVNIYGGRVGRLAKLVADEPALAHPLDPDGTVLAAEVALAAREEFAVSLSDFVHRRLMIGLSPDLGTNLTLAIAAIAATELRWSSEEAEHQLGELNAHNARLRRQ